ncbi:MAG: RcnB family protein [Acinetobacter sp.]
MKLLIKSTVLALTTAIATTAVFAAPNDIRHEPERHEIHKSPIKNQSRQDIRPSRDWRVGHKVPSQHFRGATPIDYRHYKKLPRPGHQQKWYKIHGDYVLINTFSHNIIRIVHG